jgi:superfamily I DNA/RNA helicase
MHTPGNIMSASNTKFLEGLNPQQREAVCQTDGPVLVLAGAGSGKTRVITRRIAHILANGLAKPEEVLAVTFTNKAAEEMRDRVAELIGKAPAKAVTMATFHSFCLRVLRANIEQIGYRRNFTIASESDVRTLLRRVTDEMHSKETAYSPSEFQAAISLCKNTSADPEPAKPKPVKNENEAKYQSHLADVFERYQSALRAANSLDFDDLLLLTIKLWREHPRLLAGARKRFRYVMVDEYQDTNHVQYELMHLLVEEHQNFCVVGDDDQSIYSWRGADVRNILDFERDFPKAKVVTLDQNYRSTETILAAANAVIKNNRVRREKKLWSDLGKGRAIDWFVVADEEAEARETVKWLEHIRERSNAKHTDFALLYRSNMQSKPLEIAFRQAGIPYVVYGGQDFFERAEVKDIISYLKIVANPHDEAAFLRIINMPRRGIGDTTLHLAHDLCREEKISLGHALAELLKRNLAPLQAGQGIKQFLALLTLFRKRFRDHDGSLSDITADLITAIDYRGELERTCRNPEQAINRWQNVELVTRAIGEYEERAGKEASLTTFLDESHLNTDQDRASRDQRRQTGVSLMTIHSAKGLEFPFVFIMGLEDGLIPHERSIKENSLEEERRLFYVALTRGRRHVTLFEALSREKHGKERMCKTSRFMREIPEELLQQRVFASREMLQAHLEPPAPKPKKKRSRAPKKKPA